MLLALDARGMPAEVIATVTGCPKGTVARYVEDFDTGQAEADFGPYFGAELGPKDLCRLHGTWHELIGGHA